MYKIIHELLQFLCSIEFLAGGSLGLAVLFLTMVGLGDFVGKTPRTFLTKLFGINVNYTDPKQQKEHRRILVVALLSTLIFAACEPIGKDLSWYRFLTRSICDVLFLYIFTRVLILGFLYPVWFIFPQLVYYKRKRDGVYSGTIIDPEDGVFPIRIEKKLINLQLIDSLLGNEGDWVKTANYCAEQSDTLPCKLEWSAQTPFTVTYIPYPPQEDDSAELNELQLSREVVVAMLFGEITVFIPKYRL